eukprot:TRINITY_DN103_c3_g1_i1.p1 TRINITY_DN103_c3_g1~~TRINITY_DN103_c3_g1_i1.p1  ORF type:complete len:477 (+),score=136.04 TRINITY_DN103_c3_g1_i1:222-1652(+)
MSDVVKPTIGVLDLKFSDIELLELKGKGAFGEVYRARHKWLGEDVAVKIFKMVSGDDSELREMTAELGVLAEMRHPNIVSVYGACFEPPNLALVMEFCPRDLFNVLHKEKMKMTIEQLLVWSRDIVSGMLYLHEGKKSIHRDLKSGNLLISKHGNIKIADFGVAKVLSSMETSPMTITGTIEYMAPEIAEGEYNPSVDVYAFGVILWEMAACKRPYGDFEGHRMALMYKQHEGMRVCGTFEGDKFVWKHPLPSWCPPELSKLVERCLHHDPTVRPTFSDIYDVILGIMGEKPLKPLPLPGQSAPGFGVVTAGGGGNLDTVAPSRAGGSAVPAMTLDARGNVHKVTSAPATLKPFIEKFNKMPVFCSIHESMYKVRLRDRLSFRQICDAIESKVDTGLRKLEYMDSAKEWVVMNDDEDLADAIQSSADRLMLMCVMDDDEEDDDDDDEYDDDDSAEETSDEEEDDEEEDDEDEDSDA